MLLLEGVKAYITADPKAGSKPEELPARDRINPKKRKQYEKKQVRGGDGGV